MTRYRVGLEAFGYYIVEADDPDDAIAAASEKINTEQILFDVDGVDWGDVDVAEPWERETF